MPNWRQVLEDINNLQRQNMAVSQSFQIQAAQAVDGIRKNYLLQLHSHTGRNIIAYYSGWLSKPDEKYVYISDEDKNGFMMAVHQLDRSKGLDLILHTPGGEIAATESIVHYLRKMFNDDIRAIVPQIAMSAGTMMALSCKQVLMCKHSNLGPIDPHFGTIPADLVVKEFEKIKKEIKDKPNEIVLWEHFIRKYPITFVDQCKNAIEWSKQFVQDQLVQVMFKDEKGADKKAKKIVQALSDNKKNRSHMRHIHYEECKKLGINIGLVEEQPEHEKLQDLILTVHHCYMHSLMNTTSFKIIENQNGAAFVKQKQLVRVQNS